MGRGSQKGPRRLVLSERSRLLIAEGAPEREGSPRWQKGERRAVPKKRE